MYVIICNTIQSAAADIKSIVIGADLMRTEKNKRRKSDGLD